MRLWQVQPGPDALSPNTPAVVTQKNLDRCIPTKESVWERMKGKEWLPKVLRPKTTQNFESKFRVGFWRQFQHIDKPNRVEWQKVDETREKCKVQAIKTWENMLKRPKCRVLTFFWKFILYFPMRHNHFPGFQLFWQPLDRYMNKYFRVNLWCILPNAFRI